MDEIFKISMEEIAIVLNNLYIDGMERIAVEYPFLELSLFSLDLNNFEIEVSIDRKDFERRESKADLGNYKNFLDSMVISGVVPFRNVGEVNKLLRRKQEEYLNPFFSPTSLFIGIDTNVAYYNGISNFFKYDRFGYAISQIVIREIDSKIHEKYSPKDISLFESLPYGKYAKYFINGSVKESRIAKMALAEIYWMEKNLKTLRIRSETFPSDKEIRDKMIAEDYYRFAKEHGVEIIVLSADKDFAFHAQSFGISSIHLELPHEVPRVINTTFKKALKLIYVLTIIMGLIKIEDNLFFGEYPGKTSEDYINRYIGGLFRNRNILRDIQVCRRWYNES